MTQLKEPDRIFADQLPGIGAGIEALVTALDRASDDGVRREIVRRLPDRELLTAAMWIRQTEPVDPWTEPVDPWTETGKFPAGVQAIADECKHRAQQGRTFGAYLDQPTLGELLRRLLDHS